MIVGMSKLSVANLDLPLTLNALSMRLPLPTADDLKIEAGRRNAAVAMIFSMHTGELTLCFGKRAAFEGDPWSGGGIIKYYKAVLDSEKLGNYFLL